MHAWSAAKSSVSALLAVSAGFVLTLPVIPSLPVSLSCCVRSCRRGDARCRWHAPIYPQGVCHRLCTKITDLDCIQQLEIYTLFASRTVAVHLQLVNMSLLYTKLTLMLSADPRWR